MSRLSDSSGAKIVNERKKIYDNFDFDSYPIFYIPLAVIAKLVKGYML